MEAAAFVDRNLFIFFNFQSSKKQETNFNKIQFKILLCFVTWRFMKQSKYKLGEERGIFWMSKGFIIHGGNECSSDIQGVPKNVH